MTHRIVIVGGGAGGLELATRLGNRLGRHNKAHITLVDANLTHIWKPLFHEVAAGSLNPGTDELNYVAQAKWNHFHFQYGRMSKLDREAKVLVLDRTVDEGGAQISPERQIAYDTLVISVGSQCNDFGTPGVQDHCLFLDSRSQAERLHRTLLNHYLHNHATGAAKPLTISIVGAGATGVELCAELHSAVQLLDKYGVGKPLPGSLKVYLIEAGERILPALPERISQSVHRELVKLGIEVLIRTPVRAVNEGSLTLDSEEILETDFSIWAAGIKAPAFLANLDGLETNRLNQLVVKPTLQTNNDPSVYALGDCASCPVIGQSGKFVPPRAQAAHQQAKFLAQQLERVIGGKTAAEFVYRDYGTLVSLASFNAVGTLMGNLRGAAFVEGLLARVFYMSLYRMHQASLFGLRRVAFKILADSFGRTVRPKLRLH